MADYENTFVRLGGKVVLAAEVGAWIVFATLLLLQLVVGVLLLPLGLGR